MMRNMIQIDKNKLASLLRNKNLAEISRQIGYSSNYLSNALGSSDKSGKMSKAAINALDIIYGIKYEDYKPGEKAEEKETVKEVLITDLTKVELYELIYTAVYEAVKKAWSE